jgi:hypothetical protein
MVVIFVSYCHKIGSPEEISKGLQEFIDPSQLSDQYLGNNHFRFEPEIWYEEKHREQNEEHVDIENNENNEHEDAVELSNELDNEENSSILKPTKQSKLKKKRSKSKIQQQQPSDEEEDELLD